MLINVSKGVQDCKRLETTLVSSSSGSRPAGRDIPSSVYAQSSPPAPPARGARRRIPLSRRRPAIPSAGRRARPFGLIRLGRRSPPTRSQLGRRTRSSRMRRRRSHMMPVEGLQHPTRRASMTMGRTEGFGRHRLLLARRIAGYSAARRNSWTWWRSTVGRCRGGCMEPGGDGRATRRRSFVVVLDAWCCCDRASWPVLLASSLSGQLVPCVSPSVHMWLGCFPSLRPGFRGDGCLGFKVENKTERISMITQRWRCGPEHQLSDSRDSRDSGVHVLAISGDCTSHV